MSRNRNSTFFLFAAVLASVSLQTIFAATFQQVAEIENGESNDKRFTFLGQMTPTGNSSKSKGIQTRAVTSYYFLSQNAVSSTRLEKKTFEK